MADSTLTTAMKSVGEVMSIGRTFKESFQKALVSLETGLSGFESVDLDDSSLIREIARPNADRPLYILEAFRRGRSVDEVFELSKIDRWFLYQFEEIAKSEELIDINLLTNKELFRKIKSEGFSDAMITKLINRKESINLIEDNIYSARR